MSTSNSPLPLTDEASAETAIPAVEPPAGSGGGGGDARGSGDEGDGLLGGVAGQDGAASTG